MPEVPVRWLPPMQRASTAFKCLGRLARFSTTAPAAPLLEKLLGGLANRLFAVPMTRGDLDFLEGHRCGVQFKDLGVCWVFTLANGGLQVLTQHAQPEVSIRARLVDFSALALRRVDADTLFFQQRLVIDGDVALGLRLKNFLDALDMDELPWPARVALRAGDRLLSRTPRESG